MSWKRLQSQTVPYDNSHQEAAMADGGMMTWCRVTESTASVISTGEDTKDDFGLVPFSWLIADCASFVTLPFRASKDVTFKTKQCSRRQSNARVEIKLLLLYSGCQSVAVLINRFIVAGIALINAQLMFESTVSM